MNCTYISMRNIIENRNKNTYNEINVKKLNSKSNIP